MTTKIFPPSINIADNYAGLCQMVSQEILELSNRKIASQGRFSIVLSGGKTPQGIYQCMASPSFMDKFQWEKIHFFGGDERWVPAEDQRSNYRMVSEALFTKVNIPSRNIHSIQTMQTEIQDSARIYEIAIIDFFKLNKNEFPRFDLVLLGMGQDGHTASIFPGSPALQIEDSLVAVVSRKGVAEERITLTLPVMNHAGTVFFIASGEEKANIVQKVFENKHEKSFPANKIKPDQGNLIWFLDKAAAGKLARINSLPKRIGIASDHGGYQLKEQLAQMLHEAAYEVIDFGSRKFNPEDDYPDFVVPLARAVSSREVERGIAICGSGVGACIAANKVADVRAGMIYDKFSARQGVEDDDMNVICLGSKLLEQGLAWELVEIFLASRFSNAPRHQRRLAKITALESSMLF